MAEQGSNNDRVNNTQRKALVTLAVEVLERKVQQARDESGDLVAQIRMQVKKELGVETIDNQIEAMENQIAILKKKKEQLGFSKYQNALLPGSKAKMLVDERASVGSEKIRELEDMRTETISGIWTSTTLTQALSILNNVRGL